MLATLNKMIVKIIYKVSFVFILLSMSLVSLAQFKLQPSLGFGSQSLKYESENTTVEGSSGITLGGELFYYVTEDLAVGAGLRVSTYRAKATIADYTFTDSGTDIDGDTYQLTKSIVGIKETHSLSAIEVPLLVRYQKWVSGSFIVFGSTGPVFVVPGSIKTEFDAGTLSTSGYYENWNLTIDDAEEYGFGTRNLSSSEPELNGKMSLAWTVEVGAEYYINKRMNLMLTAFFQPGLSSVLETENTADLAKDPFAFNGSMVRATDVKVSKVGIRIGINFDLSPPEKEGIRSIR